MRSPSRALAWAAEVGFLALAAALPWSIAAMSIAAAWCAGLTLADQVASRRLRWARNPVDLPALAWLLALLLAAWFAQDRAASLPRVGKGFLPALVGLTALHAATRSRGERALRILLGSASLAALWGFGVWIEHGATFAQRARGPAGHYMTFGGQLLLEVSLAAGIALCTRGRWRLAGVASGLAGCLALAGTFTRSAWIGLVVSLATVLGLRRPRWLLGLAIVVLVVSVLAPPAYRTRLQSAFDPRHPTNVERVYMWQAGLRMFADHPLTGVGLQDLHPLYDVYRSQAAREPAGHLHDVFVQIAATMGAAGLGAFLLLYAGLFRAAGAGLKARPGADGLVAGVSLGVTGALTGFLVAGLFEWNFGDEELLDLLYVLVGLAWAARSWEGPKAPADDDEPRPPDASASGAGFSPGFGR
ncbi:MAG TPA: O-antigen ligase family protein [Candidatus Eisenbacteria bacterium]